MRQKQVVYAVDFLSLLLVAGSAAAVVILGLLIYRGVPPHRKSEVAQAPPSPVPATMIAPKTIPIQEIKKEVEIKPQPRIFAVPVEMIADVSEAPPPFSEEPMILRKRRAPKSALPTDTTALKGISNEGNLGGVLVISAPKRKVRAYRNATSASATPTRRRRASTRSIGGPTVSETTGPAEQNRGASDSPRAPQASPS
jgi:hypothetical protein